MPETIIPLRPKGEDQTALARIDRVAAQLLAGGQAASLQAARIETILTDLRVQRDQMTTVLADLRGREPSGYPQVDAANANLVIAINQGIIQIDLFIARARVLAEDAAPSRRAQAGTPGVAPQGLSAGSARRAP
ncbi:hypothetical protein [Methylobacterium sp. DCY52]|jgi:hypothetical protein|uniref:hypothetical protein n=1 Tax=Methylobacterium sp. DCY52 TaxID=739139 RepID=UPI00314568E8